MKYRVEMERKKSASEYQNMRRRVEYVEAKTDADAIAMAKKAAPQFVVLSVRKS